MALVAGLGTSLWFYGQARAALQTAQQESARANAINEFLAKDVLQSKDVIRAGTKKTVSMLEVLSNASGHVAERFKGQPLDEAAVRFQLGKTYLRMANNSDASRQLEKALTLVESRLPPNDPFVLSLGLTLAQNHLRMYEKDKALNRIEVAIQAAGPAILQRRSELAFQFARAEFERSRELGKPREAVAPGQRMVALAESVPTIDAETRFEAKQDLAELYLVLGEQARAEPLLAEAMRSPAGSAEAAEVAYARATLALIGRVNRRSTGPET